jgi:RNA polymerase sigma factor (sigma-70 family)
VEAAESADPPVAKEPHAELAALAPMVRRIVAARVPDSATADDLVQETLVRVLAAVSRIEPGMLEPYAIVTARNVVSSLWRERDRHQRNQHRIVDLLPAGSPDEDLLAREEQSAVAQALARLSDRERETLLAHEVSGQDTRSLAADLGSTAGAVAAQLNRARARLRVEYLLARDRIEPPTDRCRPVLLALSGGDRCQRHHHGSVPGHRADARHDRRGPEQDGHHRRPAGRARGGRAAARLRGRARQWLRRAVTTGPKVVSIQRQGSYLIASIHTALDDTQMVRFREDLIEQIGRHRSRGVVIDVAALNVLDSFGTRTLRTIGEVARLRGAVTVIVGIQPDVAFAMVSLGMSTGTLATALDLEEGLEYLNARVGRGTAIPSGGKGQQA